MTGFMAVVTACVVAMTNCLEYKSGPHALPTCEDRMTEMMAAVDAKLKPATLIGECLPTVGMENDGA